jgi:NodT family efflux transporter outer membrane factor (OMF) lipoprotein
MGWLKRLHALAAVAIAGAAGCTVGPDYRPAPPPVPPHWSAAPANGLTDGAAAAWSWWATFQDPELDSLIRRAAQSNPDLAAALAHMRQARALRQMSVAAFWPTLDATASYARQRQSQNQPLIGQLPLTAGVPFEYDVYNAGFDASWEIDLFGARRRALEASTAEMQGAVEARNDAMLSVLAEVARNYLELRGAQLRLQIARSNLEQQQEAVQLTAARFHSGAVSELDDTRATAQLAVTRAAIPPLETAVRASMYALAALLGAAPGDLVAELSPSPPQAVALPAAPPEVPVGLPADLLRRRPDVRRAERQLAAETARIGQAQAEWFPKLSLTGDAGVESVTFGKWFEPGSRFWSIGPSLQWRVLDFGRVRAQVRTQTAVQQAALASYEKTVSNALQEAETALVGYAQERNRRQALAVAADADRRSLQMAQSLYAAGQVNYLDVLDAQRSVYLSADQLAASDQAVCLDLVALYKALGGGWDAPPP